MKKSLYFVAILAGLVIGCGERTGPAVEFEPAPPAQEASHYAPVGAAGQGWNRPEEGTVPMARTSDLGRVCQVPDGCDGDSDDYPGCLNDACEQDCALPIFGGLDSPGYCTRACRFDYECEGAVEGSPYGDEWVCLTDGVSGVCARIERSL